MFFSPFRFNFLLGFFFGCVGRGGGCCPHFFSDTYKYTSKNVFECIIREGVSFYMPTTLSPDFRNQPDRGHWGRTTTTKADDFVVLFLLLFWLLLLVKVSIIEVAGNKHTRTISQTHGENHMHTQIFLKKKSKRREQQQQQMESCLFISWMGSKK